MALQRTRHKNNTTLSIGVISQLDNIKMNVIVLPGLEE